MTEKKRDLFAPPIMRKFSSLPGESSAAQEKVLQPPTRKKSYINNFLALPPPPGESSPPPRRKFLNHQEKVLHTSLTNLWEVNKEWIVIGIPDECVGRIKDQGSRIEWS